MCKYFTQLASLSLQFPTRKVLLEACMHACPSSRDFIKGLISGWTKFIDLRSRFLIVGSCYSEISSVE